MYKKEVGERSPLRVFERSIHGGLGPGNLGVVLSRAGGGKTGLLVSVAIDDCLRGRKVLHVSTQDSAQKVREFYAEVFHDLAEATEMPERLINQHLMELNRRIHTFASGTFATEKLEVALGYMRDHADFPPSVIILDGFPDWGRARDQDLKWVKDAAVRYDCEIWLLGTLHREGQEQDARGVPLEIARFDSQLSVIVRLDQQSDHVRLRLLKDHENQDLADLRLELDPSTFLVRWQ